MGTTLAFWKVWAAIIKNKIAARKAPKYSFLLNAMVNAD